MADTTDTQSDLEILTQLNSEYLASDQNGDVQRYEQILAGDFMASLPGFLLRDKNQFLEMMAAPRPFTELGSKDRDAGGPPASAAGSGLDRAARATETLLGRGTVDRALDGAWPVARRGQIVSPPTWLAILRCERQTAGTY